MFEEKLKLQNIDSDIPIVQYSVILACLFENLTLRRGLAVVADTKLYIVTQRENRLFARDFH